MVLRIMVPIEDGRIWIVKIAIGVPKGVT